MAVTTIVVRMTRGERDAKSKIAHWSEASQRYDKVVERALGGNMRFQIDERLKREGHLGTVVEFGCGTGYYTKILADQADHVVATDFSDNMVQIARARVESHDNVEFRIQNWQHTSFADESFDTIFAGLVMPFVDDKVEVLKESHRILKPSGRVILADPNVMLLEGFHRVRCLCRTIVAWRGNLPHANLQPVSELIDGSNLTLISHDVITDPSHPSSTPVEYVKLLKS
ncbi:MAG: class I SAM-dependent methyltransferase [Halobacteriota archaeon]